MENNIKEIIRKELKVDITERSRKREIIEARALYFYVIKKAYPKKSLQSIASYLDMNHATVIHSLKNYNMYEECNNKLYKCKHLLLHLLGCEELQTEPTEEEKFKKRLLELERQLALPRYEYTIIENLNNLLESTEGTEQHELITLRLKAFYSMNKNIRL